VLSNLYQTNRIKDEHGVYAKIMADILNQIRKYLDNYKHLTTMQLNIENIIANSACEINHSKITLLPTMWRYDLVQLREC